MKQRLFVLRATWGTCLAMFLLPAFVPLPSSGSRLTTAAGLLLFVFGIIQAIRYELAKGERLKAIARGECPSCGQDLRGLAGVCRETGEVDSENRRTKGNGVCPECGRVIDHSNSRESSVD